MPPQPQYLYLRIHSDGQLALQNRQETTRSVQSRFNNSQLNSSRQHQNAKTEEALTMLLSTERSRSERRDVNPELQASMQKLETMGLTSPKEVRHIRYEGHIKIPTVHNDYHTRATNHGYSRSETGGIFPK